LIVETKTGLPFSAAVKKLVFDPLGLSRSFIDDDSIPLVDMAEGYEPVDLEDLQPATSIHGSAKAGNASVVATTRDEARWVNLLFDGQLLKEDSRNAILNSPDGIGCGWFRKQSDRYHETIYSMNGRAPGFSSFVIYLPQEQITVVVFGNVYSSATTPMGYELAAISLHIPHETFQPAKALSADQLKACTGSFQFGPDFYQANAAITLVEGGNKLWLRWPSGSTAALIPQSETSFIDRSYWVEVKIQR
jgi:D-alanyl-D-alanine carboxypeptidase